MRFITRLEVGELLKKIYYRKKELDDYVRSFYMFKYSLDPDWNNSQIYAADDVLKTYYTKIEKKMQESG